MRNFEELRRQLLDRLDTGRELEEAEIREAIDNLVLEEGRTCLLSLKEKNRTAERPVLFRPGIGRTAGTGGGSSGDGDHGQWVPEHLF